MLFAAEIKQTEVQQIMCACKEKKKLQKHIKYNVSTLAFANIARCRREDVENKQRYKHMNDL